MKEDQERIEAHNWQQKLRGHNRDEGYAERYHQSVHGQSLWLRKLIEATLGLLAIVVLTAGLLTGWFTEVLVASMVLGFIGLIYWGWRKMAGIRRQDRLHTEAFERQNGIDVRFGRTGADRKKK